MNPSSKGASDLIRAILDGMRPSHWIKNIFLFAAMPFGGKLLSVKAWLMSGAVFLVFCALASAVYLINDIQDKNEDRRHPEKRNRPIASGRLPASLALVISISLTVIALAVLFALDAPLGTGFPILSLCGSSYIVMNILYTFWIKKVSLMDIILISTGFVIRVIAGAEAIRVPVSPWLVVCTFMLALFISITKRRSEIIAHSPLVAQTIRSTNAFYTPERIEHMLSVAASLAIMSYSLYCISPQTQERLGSVHLVWTIPFVVYGIFRYYCISGISGYGDPVQILLKDKGMWLSGIAWLVSVLTIIHSGL